MEQLSVLFFELLKEDWFWVIVKAHVALIALLHMAAVITWVERKGSALIQNRIGANRASIILGICSEFGIRWLPIR